MSRSTCKSVEGNLSDLSLLSDDVLGVIFAQYMSFKVIKHKQESCFLKREHKETQLIL